MLITSEYGWSANMERISWETLQQNKILRVIKLGEEVLRDAPGDWGEERRLKQKKSFMSSSVSA